MEVENEKLEIEKLQKLEIFYQEQLKLRQKEKFGKSSEKIDENQITLFELFNEVEKLKEMIKETTAQFLK